MAKDYYNYNIDILQFKRLSELNEKTTLQVDKIPVFIRTQMAVE